MLSPGEVCRKSLNTAACFQISSSNLPSITGGLSKRGMTIGLAFSGGMVARFAVSAEFDLAFAVGAGDGEAELVWAAAVVLKTQSAHVSQSSCFRIITILSAACRPLPVAYRPVAFSARSRNAKPVLRKVKRIA